MQVSGDNSWNCTDIALHGAHNPPLLPFCLPVPTYLLFSTFLAHPSPQPGSAATTPACSPATNIPSTLGFSITWQKPTLGNLTPCLLCTCAQAGGSCQRSWHSSWAGKEQISTSARLLFPMREILMCDLSHLSPFPWKMSVSNFLHKPQTSSSHSHIEDENNLGNHPNAHQ